MADGGRKVRVNMSGELGQLLQFAASPELERLGRAAAKAADGAERLERSNDQTQKAQERSREQFDNARRVAIDGVATGAVRALGQQGAGATDALVGGIRQLQAALPALGATFGGARGPEGAALGLAAGEAGAALLERTFGPEFQAREEAIAAATAAFAPAAAQGVQITKEEYQEVIAQGMILAMRQIRNEGDARRAAGGFP